MSPEELGKNFLAIPNVHTEEKLASEAPLYLLLKHMDLHITGYSTVAFEAALFQVPTIFCHNNAREGFKGIFNGKLFFYASGREDMLKAMEEIFQRDQKNTDNTSYISIDPRTSVSCLEKMLHDAQGIRKL